MSWSQQVDMAADAFRRGAEEAKRGLKEKYADLDNQRKISFNKRVHEEADFQAKKYLRERLFEFSQELYNILAKDFGAKNIPVGVKQHKLPTCDCYFETKKRLIKCLSKVRALEISNQPKKEEK